METKIPSFDFTNQPAEKLNELDSLVEKTFKQNVTLPNNGAEIREDIEAIGLRLICRVIDFHHLVYKIFEDQEGKLWFQSGSDRAGICKTVATHEDLHALLSS